MWINVAKWFIIVSLSRIHQMNNTYFLKQNCIILLMLKWINKERKIFNPHVTFPLTKTGDHIEKQAQILNVNSCFLFYLDLSHDPKQICTSYKNGKLYKNVDQHPSNVPSSHVFISLSNPSPNKLSIFYSCLLLLRKQRWIAVHKPQLVSFFFCLFKLSSA